MSHDHIRDATKKVQKMAGNGMTLIDEIEQATDEVSVVYAESIITSPWWPRIKAALEAGQEMDMQLGDEPFGPTTPQRKFRDAMK